MTGVYIQNMTLDDFSDYGDYCQTLIGIGQAIEVPDHGRLIDADAFLKEFSPTEDDEDTGAKLLLAVFCQIVKDAPTIIPADKEELT